MPNDHESYNSSNQPHRHTPDENLEGLIGNWEIYRDHFAVFLGAGASVGAMNASGQPLPTAFELRNQLWREFMLRPSQRDDFDFSDLNLVTLDHAAAIAECKVGRRPIVEWIEKAFKTRQTPRTHQALPHLNPRAIFTTNYDSLIENSWDTTVHGKDLHALFDATTELGSSITPLFKPHGSAERAATDVGKGGVVITQFDFFKMQEMHGKMLQKFLEGLRLRCVIFIGYSFQDLDIASKLFAMRQGDCERQWYAVFPRNDPNVRSMYERNYRIKQIARTFEQFVNELDEAVDFLPAELKQKSGEQTILTPDSP